MLLNNCSNTKGQICKRWRNNVKKSKIWTQMFVADFRFFLLSYLLNHLITFMTHSRIILFGGPWAKTFCWAPVASRFPSSPVHTAHCREHLHYILHRDPETNQYSYIEYYLTPGFLSTIVLVVIWWNTVLFGKMQWAHKQKMIKGVRTVVDLESGLQDYVIMQDPVDIIQISK